MKLFRQYCGGLRKAACKFSQIALACLVLAFPVSALAETDGKIMFLSPKKMGVMDLTDYAGWQFSKTREITEDILSDNSLSGDEQDLIEELALGVPGSKVTLVHRTGYFESVEITVPSGLSRELFVALYQLSRNPMGEFWMVEHKMRQLFLTAMAANIMHQSLAKYAAKKLTEPWQQSNATNGYQPLRSKVQQIYKMMPDKKTEPELHKRASQLLYDAIRLVPQGDKPEPMPEFIYNWLEHEA